MRSNDNKFSEFVGTLEQPSPAFVVQITFKFNLFPHESAEFWPENVYGVSRFQVIS